MIALAKNLGKSSQFLLDSKTKILTVLTSFIQPAREHLLCYACARPGPFPHLLTCPCGYCEQMRKETCTHGKSYSNCVCAGRRASGGTGVAVVQERWLWD